nr:immunoglobulin light chain junction region [Macaca mulatta]MOV34849.1 immunoglobulin light chain junction region [Macaca mulatta]MOV35244.1 immunoglobulin light chain junction region [Macaca mulatta]
CMQGTELPLTF